MKRLYFLITVFVIAILISFKCAYEAFDGTAPAITSSAVDASGNTVAIDASGNPVPLPGSIVDDLMSVLSGYSPVTASGPAPATPGVAAGATGPTDLTAFYGTLAPQMEQDIQSAVQNGFVAAAAQAQAAQAQMPPQMASAAPLVPNLPVSGGGGLAADSPSTQQGSSFAQGLSGGSCAGQNGNQPFDSSQYIRKDSIPCWGCSPT